MGGMTKTDAMTVQQLAAFLLGVPLSDGPVSIEAAELALMRLVASSYGTLGGGFVRADEVLDKLREHRAAPWVPAGVEHPPGCREGCPFRGHPHEHVVAELGDEPTLDCGCPVQVVQDEGHQPGCELEDVLAPAGPCRCLVDVVVPECPVHGTTAK